MDNSVEPLNLTVPLQYAGQRVDKVLSILLPEYSRSVLQQWLKKGRIVVDGAQVSQKTVVAGNEVILVDVPPPEPADWPAQNIALDIVATDPEFFVINKQAGLVVHPGAGNQNGTLMNGILSIDHNLRNLPRAGIVHRLDKDTTGLMVLARTEAARQSLIQQLKERTVKRHYWAIIQGVPISGGTIDQPIGRHRHDRLKMTVTDSGKPAITHFRIIEKFQQHALIEARLESGRTHQIRVHMQFQNMPLLGDPLYGTRLKIPQDMTEQHITELSKFKRQALHARELSFLHPKTGQACHYVAEPPEDFETVKTILSSYNS